MCGEGHFELGTLGDGVGKCLSSCPSIGYIKNSSFRKCIQGCMS